MLDIMRKHASSWGIKAILTMIILSFVLFFGYSRISSVRQPSVRGGGHQSAVAVVNKMAIPQSEFRFYYDNAQERMRAKYKDKSLPDFMQRMLEQTTMSRLVQRELMLQVADKLGIQITDEQLAEAIRRSQIAQRGEFDPIFYTHQYIPYFENRFGINFEDMLRNDLRAEQLQTMFTQPTKPTDQSEESAESKATEGNKVTAWTFEVVKLNSDKAEAAQQFVDHVSPGQWKRMAKKYDAELERVDEVTISNRKSKLPGFVFEDYSAIFSLNDNVPVVDRPIHRKDKKIAILRFIERSEIDAKATPPERDDFFQQWMTQLAARSKIRTYLDDQTKQKR